MKRPIAAKAAALVLLGGILPFAAATAESQSSSCPVAASPDKPAKKKLGLGGLLGAARSGVIGSVMGAARGDGNLKSDLTGTVKAAATDAATRAATACVAEAAVAAEAARPANAGQPTAMGQSGPTRPASARPRAPQAAKYPSDLPKPADFAAAKAAYDEFGKVDCMSCEGGHAYDGWAAFPRDEFSGKYNGDAQRMGAWPVGHVHRWQGNESVGTLTVVAEEAVGGFRCRTLRYRLTKGQAAAERPGLLCWGRANQFAGKESWNEVY